MTEGHVCAVQTLINATDTVLYCTVLDAAPYMLVPVIPGGRKKKKKPDLI